MDTTLIFYFRLKHNRIFIDLMTDEGHSQGILQIQLMNLSGNLLV